MLNWIGMSQKTVDARKRKAREIRLCPRVSRWREKGRVHRKVNNRSEMGNDATGGKGTVSICCVKGCQSTKTHEHHINGGMGTWGKTLTGNLKYIARICEPCRKALIDKPIGCNYFQCGGLAFVNELWEETR